MWRNEDLVPHTATAEGVVDSRELASQQQWSYVVTQAGEVAYTCDLHPCMHGTITAR